MAGARSLGSLTIDLIAKIAGFEQGMDKAARTADKRMTEIEKRAKKLGTEMGLALSVIGGVAAAGIAKYVANTIEAEKVQAQLASRIKDTGAAAGRSIQQLNEQADKLQSLTIFDDEAIGGVQAMLLTFKEIAGLQFDRATEAVLDLSTAMGVDAQSAALQLGKALNDPIKGLSALGRAGVQFSESQRDMIKEMVEAGDIAGAQTVILDELESQMGTAAEAARNTLGGALQGLSNDFDNLLEGDTSSGGLKGTIDAINDLSDVLNDPALKSGVDTIAVGILRIGTNALEAIGWLGKFASNINKIFADAGLAPGEELNQLKARRDQLEKAVGGTLIGKIFPDTVKDELARIDAEIAKYPFRNVVSSATGPVGPRAAAGTSPTGGGGRTGKSDAQRQAEQAIKDAQRAREELEKQVQAVEDAQEQFDSYAAQLAGPMASANYQFAIEQERLNQLARDGEISTERLAEAQSNLRKEHEANVEAIRKQLDPVGELIKDYEFENELMRMGNEEREIAIALRYADAAATDEQLAKLREQIRANRELAESIDLQDGFRDSFAGFFEDVIGGTKSVGDAFRDMLDDINRMILQRISENWVEQLFGASGTSGGGSSGGWLEMFAGLFSGGKAGGGWAAANSLYEVNERGMEMASVNGRDYLLTGNKPVEITPNNRLQTAGGGVTQNFYSPRFDTKQTPAQLAQEARIAQQLAMRNA